MKHQTIIDVFGLVVKSVTSDIILRDVTFKIHSGEFVFLIGHSGSGKSTLLRTLYADRSVFSGSLSVLDFDLTKITLKYIPELRKKMGIIFQDFQLLYDRNVFENLRFVLECTGWASKSSITYRIDEVLALVKMSWARDKMPFHLSGGEQQKICIARALLNNPYILIADEPTGNLDPETAEEVLELFIELNSHGTAVLMATHNQRFFDKYQFRILKCNNGFILDSSGFDS